MIIPFSPKIPIAVLAHNFASCGYRKYWQAHEVNFISKALSLLGLR